MKAFPHGKGKMGAMALLWFVAAGCAQVGSPSGGPKDETPPKWTSSVPEVGAVEVRPQALSFIFDEYVKAPQWRSQLLVSPPLGAGMELEVRGREVILSWDDSLAQEVTYVFQFGDAVVDVNEGNPAQNLLHAFSTGTELDTLSVRGQVRDALTGQPLDGFRVLLYPDAWPVDSLLAGALPSYVATTDGEGRFEAGYLPKGGFRVLAVEDDNRNYAWDAGEMVAVGPASAKSQDTTLWDLKASPTRAPSAPYLTEARRDTLGWARWKLNDSWVQGDSLSWALTDSMPGTWEVDELSLQGVRGGVVRASGWTERFDSLALQMVWHHMAPWGEAVGWTDTLDVPRPRVVALDSLSLVDKPMGSLLPGESGTVVLSAPVQTLDTSRWRLAVDSVPVTPVVQWDPPSTEWSLAAGCAKGSQVEWTFLPGVAQRLSSLEWWPRDTLTLTWQLAQEEDLATWVLSLEGVRCPGQLELTNAKGNRLDLVDVAMDTLLRWPSLAPGQVQATWWSDPVGDGVWRSVDVEAWTAPEPVAKSEAVELRANWLVETTWVLDSVWCLGP